MKTGLWRWIRCWLLHRRYLLREGHDPTNGFGFWRCRKCKSWWYETTLLTAKRDYIAEYDKLHEFAAGQVYDENQHRVATVSVIKHELTEIYPHTAGAPQ